MSLMTVMDDFWGIYNNSMEKADPRVLGLPLAQSPGSFLSILLLYLLVVLFGPKMMEQHKPLQLKWVLVLYNFAMVALNFWIFAWVSLVAVKGGFSLTCQLVDYSNSHEALTLVVIAWLFFFSKLVELLDTIYFILRKKNSQITFLHVYHHTTIVVVTWSGLKWVPGGQSYVYPLLNTLVHVVMYIYYGMSAIGPHMQKYLWWKRYLTIFQLSQFVFMMGHTTVNHFTECKFPKVFNKILFAYLISILGLFLNFYIRAYLPRRAPSRNKVKKTS